MTRKRTIYLLRRDTPDATPNLGSDTSIFLDTIGAYVIFSPSMFDVFTRLPAPLVIYILSTRSSFVRKRIGGKLKLRDKQSPCSELLNVTDFLAESSGDQQIGVYNME